MTTILKTGDVKRYRNLVIGIATLIESPRWATIEDGRVTDLFTNRYFARLLREPSERIAKVISCGPKFITVQISK